MQMRPKEHLKTGRQYDSNTEHTEYYEGSKTLQSSDAG